MLPFTRDQFLNVFADYNRSLWPFVIALWVAAVWAFVRASDGWREQRKWLSGLLAVQWAWSAVAYHAAFFAAINPAAVAFSALFTAEAALLVWHGVIRDDLRFGDAGTLRRYTSQALIVYALVYPVLSWLEGNRYPWLPTFGVPCPTTILTIGFLLAATPPVPHTLVVVPILWGIIGGSAAFLLDMHVDLMLLLASVGLTLHAFTTRIPWRQPT
ncbi:MAG TPA: DUF6064 family protein [Vicinamibacterales bacterium]|jgi:hypothetical protein|nr:DUF6064 family protein [Vicinamibacterales bacterium]